MRELLNHPILKKIGQYSDVIVAGMILLIVLLIIIPLPSVLLDLFLTLNIGLSVLILLLAIFSKNVLDFSIFPTLLLVTTLFRLALNISSTRLILSTGEPGEIVTSFGEFVTNGDLVVGSVIFIIIVIVQFLVITNGSGRVAEVSARFTLDAMPGKQMAIDADLNAGLIDERQAKVRRERIQVEAEFYGAMDGASKFVKGDAIAGIIVVFINFLGGVIIFMMKGYEAMEAIEKFGILTIGDGLVSQIPALLISVAAGIIVTRTPSEDNLGTDLMNQLFSMPKAVSVLAGVLVVLAIVPGLPFFPFMVLAILSGVAAYLLFEGEKTEMMASVTGVGSTESKVEDLKSTQNENMARFLQVRTFEIELGGGLMSLVEENREKELLDRIYQVRRQVAEELGILVPKIHLRDNILLGVNQYNILIKGVVVGTGELYPQQYLVMNPERDEIEIEGVDTMEPAFGLKAKWIHERLKPQAHQLEYTIVDDVTVLITHLKEVIKWQAFDLLGRQELKLMVDALKEEHPNLVEDVLGESLSMGDLLKVLRGLLKENVSIRDLATIIEVLGDQVKITKDIEQLTEQIRHALNRRLALPYLNERGVLEVVSLHPILEQEIARNIKYTDKGSFPSISPQMTTSILEGIELQIEYASRQQKNPVLLVSPQIRPAFRKLTENPFPVLPVLSLHDIANSIEIEIIGMVKLDEL